MALEERKQETSRGDRGWSGLRQGWVRPALIVGCGVAASTQLSGIEMIMVPGAALSLIVFMFFNAGGLQLMGWLTGSEIYPLAVRGAGTAAQSATLWGTNLIISVTLLAMIEIFGVGQVFWIYTGFNVAAFLFVWQRLPELTGHSLEDIEQHLADEEFAPSDLTRA